ncbi:UNVERIFIED_CONTAM: hypothetical protein K2H54_040651 [Gekko kuhli]
MAVMGREEAGEVGQGGEGRRTVPRRQRVVGSREGLCVVGSCREGVRRRWSCLGGSPLEPPPHCPARVGQAWLVVLVCVRAGEEAEWRRRRRRKGFPWWGVGIFSWLCADGRGGGGSALAVCLSAYVGLSAWGGCVCGHCGGADPCVALMGWTRHGSVSAARKAKCCPPLRPLGLSPILRAPFSVGLPLLQGGWGVWGGAQLPGQIFPSCCDPAPWRRCLVSAPPPVCLSRDFRLAGGGSGSSQSRGCRLWVWKCPGEGFGGGGDAVEPTHSKAGIGCSCGSPPARSWRLATLAMDLEKGGPYPTPFPQVLFEVLWPLVGPPALCFWLPPKGGVALGGGVDCLCLPRPLGLCPCGRWGGLQNPVQ